jgi:hypothetical protein
VFTVRSYTHYSTKVVHHVTHKFLKPREETCRIDSYTSSVPRTLPRTRIPADRWPANGRPPPPAAAPPARRPPALRELPVPPAPPVLPAPPALPSPAVSPANRRYSRRPTTPTVSLGPQVFLYFVAKIHVDEMPTR